MKDYIYLGIIAVMFVVFLILHIKQNNRITKLMNRYEKFMKGKNAENLSAAIEENFSRWINFSSHTHLMKKKWIKHCII